MPKSGNFVRYCTRTDVSPLPTATFVGVLSVARDLSVLVFERTCHAVALGTGESTVRRDASPWSHCLANMAHDRVRFLSRTPKSFATERASAIEAETSSSAAIVVVKNRGFTSAGTGLRSYAGDRRHPLSPA